ncbi:MAG: hypothetical protein HC876_13520, partial [Chloroflexaceae bacterium]|nr:hypothetical protein [Chloroflexaceae bacterium]
MQSFSTFSRSLMVSLIVVLLLTTGGTLTPVAAAELAPEMGHPADASLLAPNRQQSFQGDVTLDVQAPETVIAGDTLVYTYVYENTTAAIATGIRIEATWANFSPTQTNNATVWCDVTCVVLEGSVVGADVTISGSPSISGITFAIDDLAPGEEGQFSIQLRTNSNLYPRTGEAPRRASASGILFLNNSNDQESRDTVAPLFVGPVFVVEKQPAIDAPVYPLQPFEYIISVGNATDEDDLDAQGNIRADAIPAEGTTVVDIVNTNFEVLTGTFISGTGTVTITTQGNEQQVL